MKKHRVKAATVSAVDRLNLPKDLLLGAMNIVVTGQYEVYIENYKNIVEYTDRVIKIRGKGCNTKILGQGLCIEYFSKDDMCIKGCIKEIIYY